MRVHERDLHQVGWAQGWREGREITDEMIERGTAEVRGALQQYYDGKIEAIQPGSLAEDVLRAALSSTSPRQSLRTEGEDR